MKRLLKKYMLCLSAIGILSVFAACSSEDDSATSTTTQTREALQLTVSAGDFVTDGAPATRAADNGNVTTFESGDCIGLIVLKNNGKDIVADNVPYKYNGSSWAFDADNSDTKSVVYYDNGIKNVTYIAYFPYSKEANGATTIDQLKDKFIPKTDQSSKADYRASDLMVWDSGDPSEPQKKLDKIVLAHAYASVSLSPEVKYTLADGNSTDIYFIPSDISDVSFTVGSVVCLPFQAEDGSFRCILPAGTNGIVRWFYTLDDKIYGGERNLGNKTSENTRYAKQETINLGTYSLDKVQMGDFYCKKGTDDCYLIPGEIVSLSDTQKDDCLGIVLKAGKDEDGEWKDDCVYKQKDGTTDMATIHGYVLALYDANGGTGCQWGPTDISVSTNGKGFIGYENTLKIIEKNNSVGTLSENYPAAYWATEGYETKHPAPNNSSGWFLPSFSQCKYWFDNRDLLLTQVKKAMGDNNYSWKEYWTSTEGGSAMYAFNNNNNYRKDNYFNVRPCLAF